MCNMALEVDVNCQIVSISFAESDLNLTKKLLALSRTWAIRFIRKRKVTGIPVK